MSMQFLGNCKSWTYLWQIPFPSMNKLQAPAAFSGRSGHCYPLLPTLQGIVYLLRLLSGAGSVFSASEFLCKYAASQVL